MLCWWGAGRARAWRSMSSSVFVYSGLPHRPNSCSSTRPDRSLRPELCAGIVNYPFAQRSAFSLCTRCILGIAQRKPAMEDSVLCFKVVLMACTRCPLRAPLSDIFHQGVAGQSCVPRPNQQVLMLTSGNSPSAPAMPPSSCTSCNRRFQSILHDGAADLAHVLRPVCAAMRCHSSGGSAAASTCDLRSRFAIIYYISYARTMGRLHCTHQTDQNMKEFGPPGPRQSTHFMHLTPRMHIVQTR